jgi:hypothetical protein
MALDAIATVLEFRPIECSRAPASCLCSRCRWSAQVALLLFVPRGRLRQLGGFARSSR